jgi:glycerate 2-kinase
VNALASPASCKGVLSALEAAMALAVGMRGAGLETDELPVADGGEGTAEVFAAALGGEWRSAAASDPLGRPVEARYLVLEDGSAVVEAAQAVGLRLLAPDELDPLEASSSGLGELLGAISGEVSGAILVGLGDTATVDGGAGMLESVGESLSGRELEVLCDVRSPLLGERGAARAFGPQKGASPEQVEALEARLAGMAELRPYAELPGAGAAGGLGAALAALGGRLRSGATVVLERIDFESQARAVDLVVTGEGTLDRSSTEGKAVGEVVEICGKLGVRCELFGGRVEESPPGTQPHALSGDPERAADDLVELGGRLARALLGVA